MRKWWWIGGIVFSLLQGEGPTPYEFIEAHGKLPPQAIDLSTVVQVTLANQWNIQLAFEEAERFKGIAQFEAGPFDTTVDTSLTYTWQKNVQVTGRKSDREGNILFQDVGLRKLFRLGTEVSLTASVDREFNPIFSLSNPFERVNNFVLQFAVDQPLLRRFIYNPEAMAEKSACLNWKAAKWDALHEISAQLRIAVNAYWDLAAAEKVLHIREESQARLEDIAHSIEKLVEGGQMAASELNQQYAELAREERRRTEAEQGVYAAFNRLLLEIGSEQASYSLASPHIWLEDFPMVRENNSLIEVNELDTFAVNKRMDLLAAQLRVGSSEYLVKSAKNAVLPELNLLMGANVLNNTVGRNAKPFYSSLHSRLPEQEYIVGFRFSKPLCNDAARGDLRRRRAEKIQACITQAELQENIRSDVATSLRNHYSLINEMRYAKEAVLWWQKALTDELERLKEGLSTLFVVLDFENRLSDAQLEEVFVHTRYAQNIVDLMFFTGILITPCDGSERVMVSNFRNLEILEQL